MNNNIYIEALRCIASYVEVNNKSFLITGASGLIGSCMVDLLMLLNKNGKKNHVYALGRNIIKLEDRFKDYLDNDCFHIIEQDICNKLDDGFSYDYIVHGASNAAPVAYAKYPVETMKTTLLGAINVLEYGKKHKNCTIVMLSTFEVYGKANHDTYLENDAGIVNFNMIRSSYPESKRSMEILSKCYNEEYGVNVRIARLSSIYGPTMISSDSKAHAQFLRRALSGKDIVLKSKGEQRRSYTCVLDAVSGILTVLFRGGVGECYNISNQDAVISIAELAKVIAQLVGVEVTYEEPGLLENKGFSTPQDIILDSEKLCSLGWSPLYDIPTGMKITLDILKDICNQ